MFVDTHAHLYAEYYDSVDEIVKQSHFSNVSIIVNSGVDYKSNSELLKIVNHYNNMFVTLGIHPEYANSYEKKDLNHIKQNLSNSKVIAIGEIGLDYHYEGYNKEKQIELFKEQLSIAEKNGFPVVIHSRQATEDTLNILQEYKTKGIIHSFSGSVETAKEYIKLGYKLGINGVVTFKNANIKNVIKEIGINNIVLETDSPYLTPVPFRGKKNNPSNIVHIAEFLSEYLNISMEELSKITNANVASIFDKIIL